MTLLPLALAVVTETPGADAGSITDPAKAAVDVATLLALCPAVAVSGPIDRYMQCVRLVLQVPSDSAVLACTLLTRLITARHVSFLTIATRLLSRWRLTGSTREAQPF